MNVHNTSDELKEHLNMQDKMHKDWKKYWRYVKGKDNVYHYVEIMSGKMDKKSK